MLRLSTETRGQRPKQATHSLARPRHMIPCRVFLLPLNLNSVYRYRPPLRQMLSKERQDSVTLTIESRLADYFDGGEDSWLMTEGGGTGMGTSSDWRGGGGGSGSRSSNVDARAAAAWLAGGVDAGHSSILAES